MPVPKDLEPLEILFNRGYWPNAPDIPALEFVGTMRRGSNVFIRSGGRVEVANGLSQVSSQNVGARIFANDTVRATIDGALVGSRRPYAGLIPFDNDTFFYLSELTNAKVYFDEVEVTGVTTSATAGRLRVAIPNGSGGFDDYDAGFDKPTLTSSDVLFNTGNPGVYGTRNMAGLIGVALAPWRTKTNAIGPPSEIIYNNIPSQGSSVITIHPPTPETGQDGWIFGGTRWDDRSGEIKVVRYVRLAPRGTFTATNGSPTLTAPVGAFWTQDLREHDRIVIEGNSYEILTGGITPTTITLDTNFITGSGSGKTMTMMWPAAAWYDDDLGKTISKDVVKAPRAAAVTKYAGLILLWGVPDKDAPSPSAVTGNSVVAMLPNNPEHCGLLAIGTQTGSDIVNALGADGPLYLATTTGLEVVSFTGDPDEPYKIRQILQPGFKATANVLLDGDYIYGFNGAAFRTQADENIDQQFAEPVHKIMKAWDPAGVMLASDPVNKAVLWMYDDGASTTVLPFMTQLSSPGNPVWGPELNFSARIIDSAVVNNKLYVIYLSGGNYRVNLWEGGAGIGWTRYGASQYYDPRLLARNRVRRVRFAGKAGTIRVYAATYGAAVPDVSNTGATPVSFTLSDTDTVEPEIGTAVDGAAFAFRVDFPSNDGRIDKLVVAGTPKGTSQ